MRIIINNYTTSTYYYEILKKKDTRFDMEGVTIRRIEEENVIGENGNKKVR